MTKEQNDVLKRLDLLQKNVDILRFLHLQGRSRAVELLCDMHELRAKIVFGFLLHIALNLNGELLSNCIGEVSKGHEGVTLFRFARSIIRSIKENPPERFKRLVTRTIP